MNFSLVCLLALLALAKGCHYGKGASDDDDEDDYGDDDYYGSHGRRRRNVVARQDLSDTFTECMEKKAPPDLISDMRSVVNFALEHSLWYEVSDTYFCGGKKDTFECWQGIMDLLIDSTSGLLGPARECVLEYAKGIKTGGYRRKRSFWENGNGRHDPVRTCPSATDAEYVDCLTANCTNNFLLGYNIESIVIFIRNHYSRCRLKVFYETWNKNKIGYRRDCGSSRFRGPNGERLCLPLTLLDITKDESTLRQFIRNCTNKCQNITLLVNDPGEITVDDLVGYCHPDSNLTRWFDNFDPNGTGDRELIEEIRHDYPGEIECAKPSGIRIRATMTNMSFRTTSYNFRSQSAELGFECRDADQYNKKCENFKVRFCCYEDSNHHNGHQDQQQRHQFQKTDDTVGKCEPADSWSRWMNNDRKQSDGESELFEDARLPYCNPVAVQARIAGTSLPYKKAHNNMKVENPTIGIQCAPEHQPKEKPCLDLEVRFCCRNGIGAAYRTLRVFSTRKTATGFQFFP